MFGKSGALILGLFLGVANCQDYTDECPEKNGFFADAVQCDRYYECKDGQIIDHLCPDGLVFDESSVVYAKCSFPFSVDCSDRPELQKPKSTALCPRQNGYFPHEDPTECGKFYFCVDGVANPITCPEGLIFSPKVGQCAYSDQANRPGCEAKDFYKFTCPDDPSFKNAHPRFPDPTDCAYFYICIGGTDPRRTACELGLVYNNETSSCVRQETIDDPVCSNWYNETFLETIRLGPAPGSAPPNPTGVPLSPQQQRDRVVVRRRKPVDRTALPTVDSAGQQIAATPGRIRPESKVPLSPASSASLAASQRGKTRQSVRTRVRLPNQPEEELAQGAADFEQGPPQFALSSDEDIQRFRDENRFSPQPADGSRLTFLQVDSNFRKQPRPQARPETSGEPPRRTSQSRRPAAARPENDFIADNAPVQKFQSRRPAIARPENDFVAENAPVQQFQSRRPAIARPEDDFVAENPSGGRQRLQVTPIRVNPQAVEVDENPAEFENFKRIPVSRQRSRGQQG